MANLLLRDDEKEMTPRLEKAALLTRGLQILSQVKGIRTPSKPEIRRPLVFPWPEHGYKM